MREQIEAFLGSLQEGKGYSNNTIIAYRNDLGQFLEFLWGKMNISSWGEVSRDHLAAYVECLRNDHEYASATVARKVAATKSFFRYLVDQQLVQNDPSATLDSPNVRKYLPTAISQEEVERLLNAPAKDRSARGLRDCALLELLYATGMRVSEVVALNVEDINLAEGCVHCANRVGKTRQHLIPIYRQAAEALRAYLEQSRERLLRKADQEERALFLNHRGHRLTRQGLWLIIKKYAEEAGITSPVTPHTLRHSFAAHRLSSGADLREVQGLLGHANVSTTQLYAQIGQEEEPGLRSEGRARVR